MKCKFFANSITAYWFFSDSSVEIATNIFTQSYMSGLQSVGGTPLNPYFDQTYRLADGTQTRFIV